MLCRLFDQMMTGTVFVPRTDTSKTSTLTQTHQTANTMMRHGPHVPLHDVQNELHILRAMELQKPWGAQATRCSDAHQAVALICEALTSTHLLTIQRKTKIT